MARRRARSAASGASAPITHRTCLPLIAAQYLRATPRAAPTTMWSCGPKPGAWLLRMLHSAATSALVALAARVGFSTSNRTYRRRRVLRLAVNAATGCGAGPAGECTRLANPFHLPAAIARACEGSDLDLVGSGLCCLRALAYLVAVPIARQPGHLAER